MSHLRTQIMHAVGGALAGIAPVELSSVYRVGDLPRLFVFATNEPVTAEDGITPPRVMDRSLEVNVRASAQSANGLADDLDELCRRVELALAMPCAALIGLAKEITLTGTRFNFSGETMVPTGDATMSFTVRYITLENAPDISA